MDLGVSFHLLSGKDVWKTIDGFWCWFPVIVTDKDLKTMLHGPQKKSGYQSIYNFIKAYIMQLNTGAGYN